VLAGNLKAPPDLRRGTFRAVRGSAPLWVSPTTSLSYLPHHVMQLALMSDAVHRPRRAMQSIFGKTLKRSKSRDPSGPPVPAKNSSKFQSQSNNNLKSSKGSSGSSKADDRNLHGSAPPAFTNQPPYHNGRPRSNSEGGWRASQDNNAAEDGDEELQLCYGYWRVGTERELGLEAVEDIVKRCGEEIKTRGMCSLSISPLRARAWAWWLKVTIPGLDSPMLFSTSALDINLDNTCSLIRKYLNDRKAWLEGA
jgi:hypothetical protein